MNCIKIAAIWSAVPPFSFIITMSAVDLYYGRGLPEPIDVVIQRDKNAKRRAAKELR